MAETLLEEVNPNGNIQAVVESDADVCYFYLYAAPDTQLGIKSVWVRNHTRAPEALEVERLRSGSPSRNPARHCRHAAGQVPLAPQDLRVVWLPEGNGASLYERDAILAIIPPWSGTKGFLGYARDNIDDVLSHAEREAIVRGYAQLAGFAKEQVNQDGRAATIGAEPVRSRKSRKRCD